MRKALPAIIAVLITSAVLFGLQRHASENVAAVVGAFWIWMAVHLAVAATASVVAEWNDAQALASIRRRQRWVFRIETSCVGLWIGLTAHAPFLAAAVFLLGMILFATIGDWLAAALSRLVNHVSQGRSERAPPFRYERVHWKHMLLRYVPMTLLATAAGLALRTVVASPALWGR